MGRKSKVTKKNVGSANDNAARGEGEDGSSEAFAVAGMRLQEQPKADGGATAFGGGSAPMETTGPPASSTLDDIINRRARGIRRQDLQPWLLTKTNGL